MKILLVLILTVVGCVLDKPFAHAGLSAYELNPDVTFCARVDHINADAEFIDVNVLGNSRWKWSSFPKAKLRKVAWLSREGKEFEENEVYFFQCTVVQDMKQKEFYILKAERIEECDSSTIFPRIDYVAGGIEILSFPSELKLGVPFYAEFRLDNIGSSNGKIQLNILETLLNGVLISRQGIVASAKIRVLGSLSARDGLLIRTICIVDESNHSRLPIRATGLSSIRTRESHSDAMWVNVAREGVDEKVKAACEVLSRRNVWEKIGPLGSGFSDTEFEVMNRLFAAYGDTEVGPFIELSLLLSQKYPLTVGEKVERLRELAILTPAYVGIEFYCLKEAKRLESSLQRSRSD